jgi:hypothetical protein
MPVLITMLNIPAAQILEKAQTILLAGAGGGYDLYTALPLYFALRAAGKTVHMANLSFATIYASNGRRRGPALVEINSKTTANQPYFPEIQLAKWLKLQNEPDTIYCIDRTGAAPIAVAYNTLYEILNPDAVLLVDGGTDSLMRGDEPMLGTPEEDVASLAAVSTLSVETKLLTCVGFGIDTFHGVCHHYVLEAIADLIKNNAFHGVWSITHDMPEVKRYREATDYVFNIQRAQRSIVNTSILAASEGHFGDHHSTNRTEGSELYINPLMSLYWFFDADSVTRRNLYVDKIRDTQSYMDLDVAIGLFRASLPESKPWITLPM